MKVGDLVRYKRYKDGMRFPHKVYHGIVLELGKHNEIVKVLDTNSGQFDYYIADLCEVVSESR